MASSVSGCQKGLAVLWYVGSLFIFVLLVGRTLNNYYGEKTQEVWEWILPNIMPTLLLITGTVAANALKPEGNMDRANTFAFLVAMALSSLYLATVLTILVYGAIKEPGAVTMIRSTGLFMGPFQGLVAASLGAFFVSRGRGKGQKTFHRDRQQ